MKPALTLSFILIWISASFSIADEPLDPQLGAVIANAQMKAQRDAILLAARPMFNHVNDWQRWAKQLDNMGVNQINGLMKILSGPQREFLVQRQRLISEQMRQQWFLQQLWMQQNALANLPFGGIPQGFNQPRLAYAPIIQWFPQGIQFNANAMITPDRRHVRMNLNPIFSSLGPIRQYNMVNGAYYHAPSNRQIGFGHYPQFGATRSSEQPIHSPSNRRPIPDWYRRNRNNP